MNSRTKEVILKTILVVGLILMLSIFPGGIILSFLAPNQEVFNIIFYSIFFMCLADGFLFMILCSIWGGIKQKPVKADKMPLSFDSYGDFFVFLQKALSQKGYHMQKNISISPNGEVTVYVKPSNSWTLACFTIIRVPELSDELIENANESITSILTEYYGGKTITDTINMISVFCVNRITPAFQKLVNSNVQQGFKNGRCLVGVSFGGKNIYIARQKDGFAITKYRRLRREFIEITNL